jgi:TRAP-type C4-dicarboxylate transport system permease large subunit
MANPLAAVTGAGAEPATLVLMLGVAGLLTARARWPLGVALAAGAAAGAGANGHAFPLRHLVEGAFSYLDPILVIATAMIFMRALADAGALDAIGRSVESRFGDRPAVLLPLVMLIVMFPGMITGSSTASVLTTGAMATSVLGRLGLAPERAAALVGMGGILGMIAPPINIPAMLIGSGIDLPYAGFTAPLALAAFPVAFGVAYGLGRPLLSARGAAPSERPAPRADPAPRPELPLWSALLPVAVAVVLMLAPALAPGRVPEPGLPLTFLLAAAAVVAVRPRFGVRASALRAVEEALPVLGILAGVGAFIQVMTLTGARGWLVALMVGAPSWAIFAAAAVSLPLFGAVSAFGSASVLGVPFLLALLGRDEIVTTAGLSMLAGLGDLMLPAALAPTLAARAAGLDDRRPVLRLCILPALAVAGCAVVILFFAPQLGRWLR